MMNAHALKGDAAACERVMRVMQKAELERNVSTKNFPRRCLNFAAGACPPSLAGIGVAATTTVDN